MLAFYFNTMLAKKKHFGVTKCWGQTMTRWDKAMWWLPPIQWSHLQLFKSRGSDIEGLTWDSPGSWRRSDPTVARTRCCQSSSNATAGPSGRKTPRCGTNALPLGWSDCGNPSNTWKQGTLPWTFPCHVLAGSGAQVQSEPFSLLALVGSLAQSFQRSAAPMTHLRLITFLSPLYCSNSCTEDKPNEKKRRTHHLVHCKNK